MLLVLCLSGKFDTDISQLLDIYIPYPMELSRYEWMANFVIIFVR